MCYILEIIQLNGYRLWLVAMSNAVIMVGNFLANSLVILCLIKTNQTTKPSYRMIFQLSLSDVLVATITQPLVQVARIDSRRSCAVIISTHFSFIFTRISTYTIALIGYDRYLRVKYPTTFQDCLTPFRVYIILFVICLVALLNTCLMISGFLVKSEIVWGLAGFIDFSAILIVIYLQIKTVVAANAHQNSVENLSVLEDIQKKIVKVAARIVFMFLIMVLPYFVCLLIRGIVRSSLNGSDKEYLEFVFEMLMNLIFMNSFGNAILFLMSNERAKKYLKQFLRKELTQ